MRNRCLWEMAFLAALAVTFISQVYCDMGYCSWEKGHVCNRTSGGCYSVDGCERDNYPFYYFWNHCVQYCRKKAK